MAGSLPSALHAPDVQYRCDMLIMQQCLLMAIHSVLAMLVVLYGPGALDG